MTVKTVVAAGGNWSASGTWSPSGQPAASDDVVITATLTGTLTIDGTSGAPNVCRSLDATGNLTGTLVHASAKQLNIGDGTTGKFLLVSALTYVPASDSVLKFVSTTTGNNITSAAKRLGSMTFDGVGGAWQLQDDLNPVASATITLTNGSFDTNSKTIGASAGVLFSSSNSNTRSLTLGTTTWNGTNTNGATFWDITNSTGMTLSAASSTINIGQSTGGAVTFSGGGLTYGTVTNTNLSSTSVVTISGANTYGTLTLSCSSFTTTSYIFSANQTVSGTFTSNGNSVINRVYLRSSARGTARTISAGTFTFTNLDMQDLTKAGAGSGNISAITGLSGDCGGNSGWTFTTPANQYWVPSAGTSTGSMSAVTRWASTSGGTAGTGRSPLPQDTAIFNASSIDAGSRIVTQDKPRICGCDWTGVTNTPAWTKTTICSFFGSIIMVSGMTNTGTQSYTYEGRVSSTLTTGALTWPNSLTIDCVDGQGSLTQGDNLSSTSSFFLTSGTFSGASTYTTSFSAATLGSATTNQICTMNATGNMVLSAGLILNTGVTVNMSANTVSGGNSASYAGGTSNIKGFSGSLTFTQTSGTHIIGTSGISCTAFAHSAGSLTANGAIAASTTFQKTGTGTLTINAASTATNGITFTGSGTVNLNANLTGLSTLVQTGVTVNFGSGVTLAYNNGSYVAPTASGGGGYKNTLRAVGV